MKPVDFPAATHSYGTPEGWDSDRDGPCDVISVYVDGAEFTSCWKPTPAERAAIYRGEPVMLTVFGGQPPVMLWMEGVKYD